MNLSKIDVMSGISDYHDAGDRELASVDQRCYLLRFESVANDEVCRFGAIRKVADPYRRFYDSCVLDTTDHMLEIVELFLVVGDKNQPDQELSPSASTVSVTPTSFAGIRIIRGAFSDHYVEIHHPSSANDLCRRFVARLERRQRFEERCVIGYFPIA